MSLYMQYYECFAPHIKIVRKDQHSEVFKFLKVLMNMLQNCVSGNFINFAICDFYNDSSFTEMSKYVFQCIFNMNMKELQQYEKINKTLFKFIEEFFKKNIYLIFTSFEESTIKNVIEQILIPGLQFDSFELRSLTNSTLDNFNEFVF